MADDNQLDQVLLNLAINSNHFYCMEKGAA